MDVFLLTQHEPIRASDSPSVEVDGFPDVNDLLRTIDAEDSVFRSIASASALCELAQKPFVRCVCHLFVAYKAPKRNARKESFYLLFDRLTEFVEQQDTEVDTVIEAWLIPTLYEQKNESLGHLTPREYLSTQKPEISSYQWT
jgi:hypothetical protein